MARNRIVVDVVTEEELSPARLRTLSRETSDWVFTIAVEPDDRVDESSPKNHHTHLHDAANGICDFCVENGARDGLD